MGAIDKLDLTSVARANAVLEQTDAFGKTKAAAAMGALDREFFYSQAFGAMNATQIQKQPYMYHPWTFACAYTTMINLARLHFYMYYKGKEADKIHDHPVLDLLRRPNLFMTRSNFIEAIVAYMLLCIAPKKGGQSFLICTGAGNKPCELGRGEIPANIMVTNDKYVRPDLLAMQTGINIPKGWIYDPTGHSENAIKYTFDQIVRINQFNPYTLLEGVANEQPARFAILQDVESDLFNEKLYTNMAIPAGILQTDLELTKDQKRERLINWYENMGGVGNNNRTAIMDKGLKYENLGLTHADMQFVEGKSFFKNQVISSFHLNKIALGDYEQVNMATLVEGRKMLWHDVYLPLAEVICEAINSQWISNIDKNLRLGMDTSKVEALRENFSISSNAAKNMVAAGMPPILAFRINGIPLPPDTETKYPWLSENPLAQKQPPVVPGQEPVLPPAPPAPPAKEQKSIVRKTMWDGYIERTFDPGERMYQKVMIDFLNKQRNRVLDNVDAWSAGKKEMSFKIVNLSVTIDAEDFLPDEADESATLLEAVKPATKAQMSRDAVDLGKSGIRWKVTDPSVDEYLDDRRQYLEGMNKLTFKKVLDNVNELVAQGAQENWTNAELAKAIKKEINAVYEGRKNQAQTIARTETLAVSGTLRNDAMAENGIEYLEWVTAHDEKVRESHADADGEVVKLGDEFSMGLKYPGDFTSGDMPEEVINCRCVAVASEGKSE
jgi:SPP1 gp7 family putative phage head morphogenesis protein